MRVLLVQPPAFDAALLVMHRALRRGAKYPPLGLLYLAAALRKANGCDVRVMDGWDFRTSVEEIRPVLESWRPDVVGISAMTFLLGHVMEFARIVKDVDPRTHVTIGGYHTRLFPNETLANPAVDSIVVGEGEITFPDLVARLERGEGLDGVAGAGFRRDGRAVVGPPRDPIRDVDSLPFPARDLLSPAHTYEFTTDDGLLATSMLSSRGCPFRCTFCPTLERYFHARSAANVVDEMIACRREGFRQVNFVDDTFNLDADRVRELCDRIGAAALDMTWTFRGRVDRVDDELAARMARAGCTRINFGMESGTDRVLTMIRKGFTVADGRRAFAACRRFGIATVGYFMIGFPGETDQEMRETVRFAIEAGVDYAQFVAPFIVPATDLYDDAVREGAIDPDFYRAWARDPKGRLVVPIYVGSRTEPEMLSWIRWAMRRFYLRPGYLWARLREIRGARELWNKVSVGLVVIYYMVSRRRE
jgi:radical SAM superfamily enzyme YgiQ (UPF0313 family)